MSPYSPSNNISWFHQIKVKIQTRFKKQKQKTENKLHPNQLLQPVYLVKIAESPPDSQKQCLYLQVPFQIHWKGMLFFLECKVATSEHRLVLELKSSFSPRLHHLLAGQS